MKETCNIDGCDNKAVQYPMAPPGKEMVGVCEEHRLNFDGYK